jgi:hypothetical protein
MMWFCPLTSAILCAIAFKIGCRSNRRNAADLPCTAVRHFLTSDHALRRCGSDGYPCFPVGWPVQ